MGPHQLQIPPLHVVLPGTVNLKRKAFPVEEADDLCRLPPGDTVFIDAPVILYIPDGGAVAHDGVIHQPQLLHCVGNEAPGPSAGNSQRRTPLRGRPQGRNVPGRHRHMVSVQERAVHIYGDQPDLRTQNFSSMARRTLSAIPSAVRP